jgi:SAM-dependent methyltransferase
MISQAKAQNTTSNVEFHQASAESTPFLDDGSVDCIVAGQAAHWFDYPRLWPEMRRLLRSGGTLAFWGYKDPVLVDSAAATDVLNRNTYGEDPETMGPYWSMPGRRYVQEKLRVIQPPEGEFKDVERIEYEPACNGPRSGEGWCFMEKSLSIRELKDYYRTWSSFHGWQEAHPGEVARSRGGKGDLADRMFDEIMVVEGKFGDEEVVVRMEWGSGLVMARRG